VAGGLHVPDADVPAADDASRGWVAFSPFTERGKPGLHVRPAFVDVET